jgi:LPS sulfotransferase NodH
MRLWETGIAGAPFEYFNCMFNVIPLATRFGALTWRDYVSSLLSYRTSPNGVFATKLLPSHWEAAKAYRLSLESADVSVTVVLTYRSDKVAQAISFIRALRTGRWHSGGRAVGNCVYNAAQIKQWIVALTRQESRWKHLLRMTRASPLLLDYELFKADVPATIDHIRLSHSRTGPRRCGDVGLSTRSTAGWR